MNIEYKECPEKSGYFVSAGSSAMFSHRQLGRDISRHLDYEPEERTAYTLVFNGKEYESMAELLHDVLAPDFDDPHRVYTLSRKPDDTVKDSSTDRTRSDFYSYDDLLKDLWHRPYVHHLAGFSDHDKEEILSLSRKIRRLRGMPVETRSDRLTD